MKSPDTRSLLSLFFLLFLSACVVLAGDEPAGVMRSNGTVLVNGSGSTTTAVLFNGDSVQTTEGALVTISSPGSSVLVPPNSHVVFNGSVLHLDTGTASISTTKGMAAQAGQYTISPATGGTAKFQISTEGNALVVRSASGTLNVTSANRAFAVAEGATATLETGTATVSNTSGTRSQAANVSPLLTDSLADFGSPSVPFCPNFLYCHNRTHVSGIAPCKCKNLP